MMCENHIYLLNESHSAAVVQCLLILLKSCFHLQTIRFKNLEHLKYKLMQSILLQLLTTKPLSIMITKQSLYSALQLQSTTRTHKMPGRQSKSNNRKPNNNVNVLGKDQNQKGIINISIT